MRPATVKYIVVFLVIVMWAGFSPQALARVRHEPIASAPTEGGGTIPPDGLHSVFLPTVALNRSTFYVDGKNGDDANPGTADRPWRTIAHAVESIEPGKTVIIADGIYRVKTVRFGPAGEGPDRMTVFKAAPDARAIFSQPDDAPPTVQVDDYVRIEGLWFGGRWKAENAGGFFVGGSPQGYGKQLVNNTLFGYSELSQGSVEYMFYQGNRFVNTGKGRFSHSIYLSGGYTSGSMAQHAIVDNNIFVGGEGYAIHGWHKAHNIIATRNFVAGHYWGLVLDGSDHVVANNFFWRQTGQPGREGPFSAWLPGENILVMNNVFAQNPSILGIGPNVTVQDNAFLNSTLIGSEARGIQSGEARTALGVSAAEIDVAIASLEQAFSQPVEDIYADPGIEDAFAVLKLAIPEGSPLAAQGRSWYDAGQVVNIGPDAPAPDSVDAFWDAFRKLGFREFDRFGQVIEGPGDKP